MAFIAVVLVGAVIYFGVRRHQKKTGSETWFVALLDYID